jgi:hypothetical protein
MYPPAHRGSRPVLRYSYRLGRGRFCPAETPVLWHGAHRFGAPPARDTPTQSHRGDRRPLYPLGGGVFTESGHFSENDSRMAPLPILATPTLPQHLCDPLIDALAF